MQRIGFGGIVIGIVSALGCQPSVECADIANSTADVNENGFVDIQPPDGVDFDPSETIKVIIGNTLFPADLKPYAAEHGVAPVLADIAGFLVRFKFTLEYENGAVQTICQSTPFEPVEFAFEAVCPVSTEMEAEIIALVPILGIPLPPIPIGFTLDAVDYECGQTISLQTTKDEDGQVV